MLVMAFISWQSCVYEEIPGPVDCSQDPVQLDLVAVEDSDCNAMDGSIEVTATGGSGTYMYSLNGGDEQASAVFANVGAGVYEILAMDENTCSATIEVSVKNMEGLNITFETSPGGCKGAEGTLTVMAIDGTEPYEFKLGNGDYTASNVFTGLQKGEYTLVVSDATGCEIGQTVKIRSGVSYAASILPIIENKCAISECHNGSQFPDFRVFKNIHDNARQIKVLTGNGTMPQDGTLTQSEIDMIACWVDDGAPEN